MPLTSRIKEINKVNDIDLEAAITNMDDMLKYVRTAVLSASGGPLDAEQIKAAVAKYTEEYLKSHHPYLLDTPGRVDEYATLVYDRLYGLGPIEKYLRNPDVTDIFVMGTRIMYVEREEKKDDPAGFTDEADVRRIIDKIAAGVGKTVNVADPYADAELYDGSRALLMIPPISDRPNIIIRKHTYGTKQLHELAPGMQNLTPEIIGYFKQAVTERKNIVVIGQTGSGKTTFLNALTYYFPPKHIVAVLEDTHEMVLPLTYVYYLKTREASGEAEAITWVDILRNCLRANPNRIILTEIRTGEAAYEFLEILNSGHRGSMTTIHASSTYLGLQRLEMLVKDFKPGMDDLMLHKFIVGAVDIVVFLDILENEQGDNTGRIIKELAEVHGLNDDGSYNLEYIIEDGKIIDLPISF
jgi:pilus assembly protein CpaF